MTSKQAIAGDHNNQQWLPPEKSTKPSSFFFNSPRILKGFFTISYENESIMSPTSILDTKPFSALTNTFWAEKKPPNPNPKTFSGNKHSWEEINSSKGISIALVDNSESNNLSSKQNQRRKLVVFGSQLRIQVPPTPSFFPCSSPVSPGEFGIKTPMSNLKLSEKNPDGIGVERENLSIIDMEQSEDYTCVISHGPNPKTTHIFGNCIVESCCGVDGCSSSSSSSYRQNGFVSLSPENFLSFCHHCKKQLQQGEDIYMYRGDKAFCSQECRCQEMLFDGLES